MKVAVALQKKNKCRPGKNAFLATTNQTKMQQQ